MTHGPGSFRKLPLQTSLPHSQVRGTESGASSQLPVRVRGGVVDPGAKGQQARRIGPIHEIGGDSGCEDGSDHDG